MGMGVLAFAAGVNIAFWTSVARRRGSIVAASMHSLSLLALPLASMLGWGTLLLASVSVTGLLFLAPLRLRYSVFLLEVYSFLSLLLVSLGRGLDHGR